MALIPPEAGAGGVVPAGPALAPGAVIGKERSATAVELDRVLDGALPLLRAIEPDRLATVLGTLTLILLVAATAAARAIFSYDHRSFDASVSNGASFAAGDFATENVETTQTVKPTVLSEEAVVRAEVSAAAVVSATPDRVEVLLYVNQFRTNVNIDGEKLDQNRVVLTMVRVADGWKVAQTDAI